MKLHGHESYPELFKRLEKDELIQPGDELLDDEKGWIKSPSCVGMRAPDPQFTSHRQYRRRLPAVTSIEEKRDAGVLYAFVFGLVIGVVVCAVVFKSIGIMP